MICGGFVTLFVRDVAHAVRFYVETLGMKLVSESPPSTFLDAGDGFRIGLREGTPRASSDAPETIALTSKLPLAETVAILENRGVSFTTTNDGGVTCAHFHDPDGNALSLYEARS